jgi:septum formation protein
MPPLVLASASPRRRELLASHGYQFEVVTADFAEQTPSHLSVGEITLFNAQKKAAAVSRIRPESIVLAADTLVSFGGTIFGKPAHLAEAKMMLGQLSGNAHEVFTGVHLLHASSGRRRSFVEISRVRFRCLTSREIDTYLALINPLDKAGAYAAQEDPIGLIEGIEGSHTNVVGLPMESLARQLAFFEAPRARTTCLT